MVLVADVVLDAQHQPRQGTGLTGLQALVHALGLFAGAGVKGLQEGVQVGLFLGLDEGLVHEGAHGGGLPGKQVLHIAQAARSVRVLGRHRRAQPLPSLPAVSSPLLASLNSFMP